MGGFLRFLQLLGSGDGGKRVNGGCTPSDREAGEEEGLGEIGGGGRE